MKKYSFTIDIKRLLREADKGKLKSYKKLEEIFMILNFVDMVPPEKKVLKFFSFFNNFESIFKAATDGDPYQQYILASLYAGGIGVRQNKRKAEYWMKQSAKQNCEYAIHQLGTYYSSGAMGFKRDDKKAKRYFMLGARLNFPPSQLVTSDYLFDENRNKSINLYDLGKANEAKLLSYWENFLKGGSRVKS